MPQLFPPDLTVNRLLVLATEQQNQIASDQRQVMSHDAGIPGVSGAQRNVSPQVLEPPLAAVIHHQTLPQGNVHAAGGLVLGLGPGSSACPCQRQSRQGVYISLGES